MTAPALCEVPECTRPPELGMAALDGPVVWVCGEHALAYLAPTLELVEAMLAAVSDKGAN